MKLKDLIIAQPALQKLVVQPLPVRCALELMRLVDAANVHLKFFTVEFNKHLMPSRMEDLETIEIDDITPISLPISADIKLSAADLKSLEKIIMWEEDP